MPRYVVDRTFPAGLSITVDEAGVRTCRMLVASNADHGVTWLHSYVTEDRRGTLCVYDAPSPEAIRSAAVRSGLPVDRIREVCVLDPYFYI